MGLMSQLASRDMHLGEMNNRAMDASNYYDYFYFCSMDVTAVNKPHAECFPLVCLGFACNLPVEGAR